MLVAQRPPGSWREGWWEFPGGKIEPGEADEAALSRELLEEIGITVQRVVHLGSFVHEYPERTVEILLWLVPGFAGEPRGLDGQQLRWVAPAILDDCGLLEADLPMIGPLRQALLGATLDP